MPELAALSRSLLIRAGRQSVGQICIRSPPLRPKPSLPVLREPEGRSGNQTRQAQGRAKPPVLATDLGGRRAVSQ